MKHILFLIFINLSLLSEAQIVNVENDQSQNEFTNILYEKLYNQIKN